MPKTRKPRASEPERRTRTIDLLPDDITRIARLDAHYRKGSRVPLAEVQVIRLALEDACILHGLEQRTDVEPFDPAGSA